MKTIQTLTLLILSILSLTSCSLGKLSHEDAKKQIEMSFVNQDKNSVVITLKDHTWAYKQRNVNLGAARTLVKQGYFEQQETTTTRNGRKLNAFALTDSGKGFCDVRRQMKGRPYQKGDRQVRMICGTSSVLSIDGITYFEDGNKAKVLYTHAWRPNNIGRAYNMKVKRQESAVYFTKYDTGWRLVK